MKTYNPHLRSTADNLYQKLGSVNTYDYILSRQSGHISPALKEQMLVGRNFEAKECKKLLYQLGNAYDQFLTESVDDMIEKRS